MSRPLQIVEPRFDAIPGRRMSYDLPAGNGWWGSIAPASSVTVGMPKPTLPETVAFVIGRSVVPHIAGPKPGSCMCAC